MLDVLPHGRDHGASTREDEAGPEFVGVEAAKVSFIGSSTDKVPLLDSQSIERVIFPVKVVS